MALFTKDGDNYVQMSDADEAAARGKAGRDELLLRNVDGRDVVCTPEEEAAIRAQWAASTSTEA